MGDVKLIDLGEFKMVWNLSWLLDGKYISFVDDDVRICVLEVENGNF